MTLNEILQKQKEIYPLLETNDFIKLIYQHAFGCEHMISNEEKVYDYLKEEWKNSLDKDYIESIGNGLCRFHFSKESYSKENVLLLTKLFVATSKHFVGNERCMKEGLNLLRKQCDVNEIGSYEKEGYHALHHSQTFREIYHPSYRLIKEEYAIYFEILRNMMTISKGIIAIDGNSASGKTTLSRVIHEVFDYTVFHMDDFYMPIQKRKENWKEIAGGNIELNRLVETVFLPLQKGEKVFYQPFNCQKQEYETVEEIQPSDVVIIEGSYSLHDELRSYYTDTYFLTISTTTQQERLKVREKDYYETFMQLWVPLEAAYHQKMKPKENAKHVYMIE